MAVAARKTVSQIAAETLRDAWRHTASARFRGGLTAALGGALALALASWRPTDPSLDAASAGAPGNLLGAAGAGGVPALRLAVGIARAADPEPHVSRKTLRWRALAGAAGLFLLAGGLGALSAPTIWA